MAKKFKVYTVPKLIYLKNGKFIAKEHGVKTPDEIKESVMKYFK